MNKRGSPPRSRASAPGFTILEVMIGVAIFAIAATGLLAINLGSRKIAEENVYQSTALNVAQNILEQTKVAGMTNFNAASYQVNITTDAAQVTTITTTRAPIPADPSTWSWNQLEVPLILSNPTASNAQRNMRMWVSVHITANASATVPNGSFHVFVYYYYQVNSTTTKNSPVFCLRTIRGPTI
jgi:prepilin-type N-terminal cleavage/methylation domain-containing protein